MQLDYIPNKIRISWRGAYGVRQMVTGKFEVRISPDLASKERSYTHQSINHPNHGPASPSHPPRSTRTIKSRTRKWGGRLTGLGITNEAQWRSCHSITDFG